MLSGNGGILGLTHYLVLWVGSYFSSSIAHPFAGGLAAIILFAASLIGSGFLLRRRGNWRIFYPALVIAAYACATGTITACGRIGFGTEQALNIRYRTYSLFFYLAIVALLFAIYCAHFRKSTVGRRYSFLATCAIAALTAFASWIGCYLDGVKQQKLVANRNLTLLRALEWIEVIPDNPDLRFLFPVRGGLLEPTRVLRKHGILRLHFVSDELAHEVRKAPRPMDTNPFGRLETCALDANRNLRVTGHAWLPERQRAPDCIVLGAVDTTGAFQPVSIIDTERGRGAPGNIPRRRSGFDGRLIRQTCPPGR